MSSVPESLKISACACQLCTFVVIFFVENAIRAAIALALTAADILANPSTLEVIKGEYTPYKSASGRMLLKHRSISTTEGF